MNPLMTSLQEKLGEAVLERISRTRIGIGGAGGLGSNVAAHLVRSGFQRLLLVDFDRVEASNLNRQFYFADQLGELKVEALAQNLIRINPELELTLKSVRVTAENIESIFEDCDLWVEAFDGAATKKMFVEQALKQKKRIVSASGMAGWGDTDTMLTAVLGSYLVVVGDQTSEVSPDSPPMSPRVGVAAAKEANVILAWALEGEELR